MPRGGGSFLRYLRLVVHEFYIVCREESERVRAVEVLRFYGVHIVAELGRIRPKENFARKFAPVFDVYSAFGIAVCVNRSLIVERFARSKVYAYSVRQLPLFKGVRRGFFGMLVSEESKRHIASLILFVESRHYFVYLFAKVVHEYYRGSRVSAVFIVIGNARVARTRREVILLREVKDTKIGVLPGVV